MDMFFQSLKAWNGCFPTAIYILSWMAESQSFWEGKWTHYISINKYIIYIHTWIFRICNMSAFLVGFFGWKEHIYTRLEDPGMYVYNMLFTPQKIVNTRYRPLTLTQFLKPEISHVSLEPFILGISNFGNLPSPADWKHFVASIKDSKTNGQSLVFNGLHG